MPDRLVFVSCGQRTDAESQLGRLVTDLINGTPGFEAYFADTVHDLSSLSGHILDALRRASGALVIMHPRGLVHTSDGAPLGVHSSVWINQEVALLAYRQFFERRALPVLAFCEESISLEGAMTSFIVNPLRRVDTEFVVQETQKWLAGDALRGSPDESAVFAAKWDALDRGAIDLLRALIDEGGHDVKATSVRRRLVQSYGYERSRASEIVRVGQLALGGENLIRLRHNPYDGDELSLHASWEWSIRHAACGPVDDRN